MSMVGVDYDRTSAVAQILVSKTSLDRVQISTGHPVTPAPENLYIGYMDLKEAYRIRQNGYQRAEEDRVQSLKALSHEDWLHGLKIVHTAREP